MNDDLLADFLIECSEVLSNLDQELVQFERNPGDLEVLKNIFRAVHSVKGSCGIFGLQRLERVAHATEDVLGKMREGTLRVDVGSITPILEAVDIIKSIFAELEKSRTEPAGDDSQVIAKLRALMGGEGAAPVATNPPASAEPHLESSADPHAERANPEATKGKSISEQTLRVQVDVLDGLMNLVGELVLTRNQLIELAKAEDESCYIAPIQQLNRVTSGLQQAVMKTRMQPVGQSWSKLPRIVRDLGVQNGKDIELVMTGQETEIDRQILQAIQDPLVHCVRNSGDHGLESSEARVAKGKPSRGTIHLNAFQEGGHIIIEIRDDGAGIDVERVTAKAIERGLLTAEQAAESTESKLLDLIFEPGFSTAKAITEISGRGVGMDVVRTNIQRIGGSVELSTQKDVGTTVRIKIPLTLAIISALIVNIGQESGGLFAIQQIGVVELVRISEGNRHLVEELHGSRVLRLREKLLPLVDTAMVLGMLPSMKDGAEFSIVVAQVGDMNFGVVVHEIFDTQEIVVKPAGRLIGEVNLFAGTTILGDGRVIPILDTVRLAARASVTASRREASDREIGDTTARSGDRTAFLLFQGSGPSPFAVPLALVSRLEEFPKAGIDTFGDRFLVKYRGGLLPLVPCDDGMQIENVAGPNVPALIFSDGKRSMGIMVTQILDTVEDELAMETSGVRDGILGAAIIQGKTTQIIDTYHFLTRVYPDWFSQDRPESQERRHDLKVLLVEDSQFFRNLLKPILESKGYEVLAVNDGEQALHALEQDGPFDVVLSDLEMPKMDGFTLSTKLRSHPQWGSIPRFALSSLSSAEARKKAADCGFSEYLVKFDQDVVLCALATVEPGARV